MIRLFMNNAEAIPAAQPLDAPVERHVYRDVRRSLNDLRLSSIKRVVSAVGVGSMAVRFVHEYLRMNDRSTA
ncbi:MAG: hypothetical protein OEV99_08595 [Nitrospira sp.]|nr:hypothetical protein [Nitrospira sp.]MDH4369894.1 hypothetical protein [Nitrospira sp.]MDH5497100.1 hypothetical protein [Nitrospira sp.]MDH5723993.1 hypothetical protein [Nitrospira sp.]